MVHWFPVPWLCGCTAFTVNWGPSLEVGILEMCAKLIGFPSQHWPHLGVRCVTLRCPAIYGAIQVALFFWHDICVELIPKWDGVPNLLQRSGNHDENWGSSIFTHTCVWVCVTDPSKFSRVMKLGQIGINTPNGMRSHRAPWLLFLKPRPKKSLIQWQAAVLHPKLLGESSVKVVT